MNYTELIRSLSGSFDLDKLKSLLEMINYWCDSMKSDELCMDAKIFIEDLISKIKDEAEKKDSTHLVKYQVTFNMTEEESEYYKNELEKFESQNS